MTKDQAKVIIEKLVNRYAEQQKAYHAADYNETKTRRDFIDPFFKALGWDMDNEQDVSEAYREVVHEDKVKIQGKIKSPDYGFKISGAKDRLFFVEAKKPSVSLKTNKEAAFQVRRYGWNSRVAVSILTNFEEFIVYDCSKKPNANDSTSVARLKTISYDQFLQEFDFIYDTFSREAVVKGRFDTYVKSDTAKKGTVTPDKDFVNSLEEWRRFIAIDIARNNLKLNEDELNFAVQLIIDRLIFLRFCEDRGVEHYGQLKSAVAKGSAYEQLHDIFIAADEKYNSGLFDFDKDKITQGLKVTNKVIKGIIDDMYYPLSQYDFKALPVEVLGNAYEQFLGKVIRINKAHHAVIEEKPEVRKAGGVFYTPQYIVDYIVENTVGKLIAGKTPKEIEKIKIVDPACGSGSFLLGAFDYLLKFHQNYYHQNPPSAKSGIITPIGTLSTAEKKKILLNNIYGVDLDANAVEVSKLSLLLKCMEGETEASIKQQITMFNERVLPDLDNNIKDGNSLIDTDFYDNEIDLGYERKIKPFSWKKQFPEIFKQGGFDVVIGNPPYRLMQPKDTDEVILKYFRENYNVAEFKIDLFHLFFQKGIRLLHDKGLLGYITPSSLLNNVYVENLRNWLITNCTIDTIALTKEKVFADADVFTAVYILGKENDTSKISKHVIKTTTELELIKQNIKLSYKQVKQSRFNSFEGKVWNILVNENNAELIDKVRLKSSKLANISKINRGLITGDRNKYFSSTKKNEKYKPILAGGDVNRYSINSISEYVFFERPQTAGGCWDEDVHFSDHKIVIRQIGSSPTASVIDKPIAVTGNIFTVISKSLEFEKYLLGIINSKLIAYYWKVMYGDFKSSFPQVTIFSLNSIPIKENPEKSLYKMIIQHVESLLKLYEEIKTEKLQTKTQQIKQRIEHAEDKINQLVYELYELTPEEIEIIEDSTSK